MDAKSRRKLEMGKRALEFSRLYPDPSPGSVAAVARLEELIKRAEQLDEQQRKGIVQARAAAARKRDLRRTMKRAHISHLASVAEVASSELPELRQKFVLPRGVNTYLAFRTAARSMAVEAESQKELLVKHGLSEPVLQSLTETLAEFDAVVEQGTESRIAHVGASAQIETVTDELVQTVRVINGSNHFRFGKDAERLAAWESASSIFAAPRSPGNPTGTEPSPPAGGDVRPAA